LTNDHGNWQNIGEEVIMSITKPATMLSCFDVADYFLALVDEEEGDSISNLKLQKLVYYAQGFHLAMYDKPLFAEKIEAWDHGPVVPELYQKYKSYGAGNIEIPAELDLSRYPDDVKELLNEVWCMYGQYSAWKLRELTHEDTPWLETHAMGGGVISHQSLRRYFLTQLQAK
jgi:uncharacterized phage-associated protein